MYNVHIAKYVTAWLTISQRVRYKLPMSVHRCHRYRAPRYLADCCAPVYEVFCRHHLHAAICRKLNIPRFCGNTFGTWDFSVAGRMVFNSCLIHCVVRPSSLNVLGGTRKRIYAGH